MKLKVSVVVISLINLFVSSGNTWSYNSQESNTIQKCKKDIINTDMGEFVWKYPENGIPLVTSEKGICWDKSANNLVVRTCDTSIGKWIPDRVTCSKPEQTNVICPEDLLEIPLGDKKYICIRVSAQPHRFDEAVCFGSDTLPLVLPGHLIASERKAINKLLKTLNIERFWLPVRRRSVSSSTYKPFAVQLPGKYWKDIFDISLSLEGTLSQESCLAAVVIDASIEMTHCNNSLHSVCVYKKDFVADSGCPQGFGAMSYTPNECFGIKWEAGLFLHDVQPISIAEYFEKRNSIRTILKEKDEHRDGNFLVGDIETADGGKFAIEMNIKERIHIVAMDETKPALSSEIVENRKNVGMTLKMDLEHEELILTVYNRNYIWRIGDENEIGIKCFSNADYDMWKSVKIKMIWENDLETITLFELKLSGDGPGFYWCEAHTIFDFNLIKTQKIIATKSRKGHSFAMLFDIFCTTEIECVDVNKNMKNLGEKVRSSLNYFKSKRDQRKSFKDLEIHKVRIMDIISVDSKRASIRCLCHVTASLKSSSVDNSYEDSSEELDSEENELGIRHDTSIRMQLSYLLTRLLSLLQPHLKNSVRSTQFCFPESFQMSSNLQNQWNSASYGQTATTLILCLQKNGIPITRKCEGDFVSGAYWEDNQNDQLPCITNIEGNTITMNLYELNLSKTPKREPEKAVKDMKDLLENNIKNLIPADFYYMSKIIQSTIKSLFTPPNNRRTDLLTPITANRHNNEETTSDIVRIYNYLMGVNESIIKPSIVLNSTNVLLDAFENLIDRISLDEMRNKVTTPTLTSSPQMRKSSKGIDESDKLIDTIEYEDVGVVVKIASNFVIFTINPCVANVSGIALFKEDSNTDSEFAELGSLRGAFKNEFYRFILANQNVDDLLFEPGLQLATYVPESLWMRLDEISMFGNYTSQVRPEARVVIKIYANDILFQENDDVTDRAVTGKIVSISIPGHDRDLPEMLPLILRSSNFNSFDNSSNSTGGMSCSYWNYKTWANDGLVFLGRSEIDDTVILCGCTHLTPFAYLIGGNYNISNSVDDDVVIIAKIHKEALDIITLLGCSLSLFGIVGIFATAATFQSWRQKASSKVLLQLSAAIALQMILFCFVNTEELSLHLIENEIFSSCIAIGACLQYSVLVQFCWMLIIAYLQFKRYVQVFGKTRPKRFFIKSTILGWGTPMIPVFFVILFDRESYIPKESSVNSAFCYPTGYSFYFGIVMPITIVIIANLIIFVTVIYNILRGPGSNIRHTDKRMAMSQVRLSILLFFLLGFTWIFGLMTAMRAGLVFSYLFSLTATLQGFVLFVYFIILDPVTRRMWGGYFQTTFGINTNYDSSTSMRETTQTL